MTATVTRKGEAECPLPATPVSAGQSGTTARAQGLTSSAGDDGPDVSSAPVAAVDAVTTTAAAQTTAAGNATANRTAAATYKPGSGASPGGGMMSWVALAGLGVLGVMLVM